MVLNGQTCSRKTGKRMCGDSRIEFLIPHWDLKLFWHLWPEANITSSLFFVTDQPLVPLFYPFCFTLRLTPVLDRPPWRRPITVTHVARSVGCLANHGHSCTQVSWMPGDICLSIERVWGSCVDPERDSERLGTQRVMAASSYWISANSDVSGSGTVVHTKPTHMWQFSAYASCWMGIQDARTHTHRHTHTHTLTDTQPTHTHTLTDTHPTHTHT